MPVLSKKKWAHGVDSDEEDEASLKKRFKTEDEDPSLLSGDAWSVKRFLEKYPNHIEDTTSFSNDMKNVNTLILQSDSKEIRRRWHELMDTPGLYSNWQSLQILVLKNWHDSQEYLSTGRAKTLLCPTLRKLSIRSSDLEWAEWLPWIRKSVAISHLVIEGCVPGEKFSNLEGPCLPSILYLKIDHLAISSPQFTIFASKMNPLMTHLDLTLGLSTRRYNSIQILETIGNRCRGLVSLRLAFGVTEPECSKEEINKVTLKHFQKSLGTLGQLKELQYLSIESLGYYLPFDKLTDDDVKKLGTSHNFKVIQMFQQEGEEVQEDSFSHINQSVGAEFTRHSPKVKIFLPGAPFNKLTEPVEPFSPTCAKLKKF